jgi:hypothetical protein
VKRGWFAWLALSGVTLCGCRGPSLPLESAPGRVTVHVETLGEYPTSVDKVVIERVAANAGESAPLFAAQGADGAQIRSFVIRAGANDRNLLHPSHGSYRVTVPASGDFEVLRGATYRVTVCRENSCRSSQFRLREIASVLR